MSSIHDSEQGSRTPRPRVEGAIKRILVPTDFSPCSAQALRKAIALARQCGAAITLLAVVDLSLHTPPTGPADAEKLKTDLWKGELERLGQTVLEMADEQIEAQAMIAKGSPAEEIARAARQCDLIAIGKRRPKLFGHLFSRRTVERVLEIAPCPVLVVQEWAQKEFSGSEAL